MCVPRIVIIAQSLSLGDNHDDPDGNSIHPIALLGDFPKRETHRVGKLCRVAPEMWYYSLRLGFHFSTPLFTSIYVENVSTKHCKYYTYVSIIDNPSNIGSWITAYSANL